MLNETTLCHRPSTWLNWNEPSWTSAHKHLSKDFCKAVAHFGSRRRHYLSPSMVNLYEAHHCQGVYRPKDFCKAYLPLVSKCSTLRFAARWRYFISRLWDGATTWARRWSNMELIIFIANIAPIDLREPDGSIEWCTVQNHRIVKVGRNQNKFHHKYGDEKWVVNVRSNAQLRREKIYLLNRQMLNFCDA